jgi:hypothetical protein
MYNKDNLHAIYINKNEIEVPSVTTILKILNKPALSKWANIMGFKHQKIEDILEKSSVIGTTVHKAIYAYLSNKYFIFITSRICGKTLLIRYLNSFLEWEKTHNIKPILLEKEMVTDLFGGTVDFYGEVDGKMTIIDYKTSKKTYPTMFLQLAGYCIMLESLGYKVEQAGIIIINENGYKEKIESREYLNKYINAFNILLKLFYEWFEINKDDGWGEII